MKQLKQFFKKINFFYIIFMILMVGLILSFDNIINKKDNKDPMLIKDKKDEIQLIKPYLVGLGYYDLEVMYNNDKKETFYNVSETDFNKIKEEIRDGQTNIILSGNNKRDELHGFKPLFRSLNICFILCLFYLMIKFMSNTANQFLEQFGDKGKKQQSKKFRQSTLNFKDVAGAEEEKEELQELVDFLKHPKKYVAMGARIPKGVLLTGPPGTGKTLLAKALAGEANVPFFPVSGSEFVEMFVGLGASRIRSLFKSAQLHAPCIIFIDEIETVARKRGFSHGNTEQEQTLNQLLIELDGYNQNQGVIVIAATNQPDFLDPALVRPGRFDRRFIVNLPSLKDREAILRLHSQNKKISPDVDLGDLARLTSGFSGAQLEGILNEAALLATRNNAFAINKKIMSEAVDRILMGLAKKSIKYSEKEKKMVAYHEVGHAVIGLKLADALKIQKVTIIPRGNAGGYNLFSNEEESFFSSKKKLLAEITSLLGGRAAEELFLDDISNGAYQDLKMATNIAKKMVTVFGMSDLGLAQFEEGNTFHKNFSDPKALEIDQAIQKIIFNCYESAKKIISENKELFLRIAEYLLEVETLSKKDIQEILETNKLSWFDEQKRKEKISKDELNKDKAKQYDSKKDESKQDNSEQDDVSNLKTFLDEYNDDEDADKNNK